MKGCIDLFSVVACIVIIFLHFRQVDELVLFFWAAFYLVSEKKNLKQVNCCVLIKNILSSCSHIQDTSLRPYCERLV